MASDATVVVRFKDVDDDDHIREHLEGRCRHLGEEFHEANHFEVTISPEADGLSAHGLARGKNTDVAAHAMAGDARQAGERLLIKLEKELRKEHDKRIFGPRREAQKERGRRSG